LFILFFIFANLTWADNVYGRSAYRSGGKANSDSNAGNGRYGNDKVQAHKVRSHLNLGHDEKPTYENVQGTPSRSSQHTSKLRSDSPYEKHHVIQDEEEEYVSRVAKDASKQYHPYFSSANSAAALATFEASPSDALQKQTPLRKRNSLAVSSIEDWKLENFVIFVTIDGTIHARSRDAGKDLWSWPTTPLIQSKRHKSRDRVTGEPPNPDDDIEWIVEAVNGGQLYWYSHESGLTVRK